MPVYWTELPFLAVLALGAGPVLFVRGFRDLRVRTLVQNTPTSRIRSMAMGVVEIQADVLERSTVTAPFSGHDCAYWEVEIALRTRNRNWNVVHRRNSGQPFFVTDGTGIAMVYPEGASCTVPVSAEEECSGAFLPECYASYLAEIAGWRRWLWAGSTMRFRERTLEEGQPVYILGTAEPRASAFTIADPDDAADAPPALATGTDGAPAHAIAGAVAGAAPRLALVPHPAVMAMAPPPATRAPTARPLTDAELARLPAGQLLSLPATEIATLGAAHAGAFGVSAAAVHAGARPIAIPPRGPERVRTLHTLITAVIRRGTNETTFIISTQSETGVRQSLATHTFAKLVGGPVLTVLGLAYLLYALAAHH